MFSTVLERRLEAFATVVLVSHHLGDMRYHGAITMKVYQALVSQSGTHSSVQRVSITARTLSEAKQKLEAEYGKGTVFYLRNEQDAANPR